MSQIGRYQVLGEVGRGGMGVVYQAFDPVIRRPVAIKTVRLAELSEQIDQQEVWDRLRRESQTAGLLIHPNIVAIHDLFEERGVAFLVMEFVNGPSLAKLLARNSRTNASVLLSTLSQTAAALDFAHSKGVVHRDVKPANILIHEDGTPKVSDFGLAKMLASPSMTQTGMAVGSPSYMAPEQIQSGVVDGRTDQYALAVTAYEGLAGRRPFAADTISALFYKILSEPVPSPVPLNPELGPQTETVFARALAKDPAARYPTCAEFVQALNDAIARRSAASVHTSPSIPSGLGVRPEAGLIPVAAAVGTAARPENTARLKAGVNRIMVATPVMVIALFTGLYFYLRPTTSEPAAHAAAAPVTRVAQAPSTPAPVDSESRAEPLPLQPPPATEPPAAAPEQPRPPLVIKEGQGGFQLKRLAATKPVFPELARQAHLQGIVRLRAVVGTNGRIHTLSVIDGHPLLVPAAMDAVRQWVYAPPRFHGQPVEVSSLVLVEFTLRP